VKLIRQIASLIAKVETLLGLLHEQISKTGLDRL
jgi:hypothetical protein